MSQTIKKSTSGGGADIETQLFLGLANETPPILRGPFSLDYTLETPAAQMERAAQTKCKIQVRVLTDCFPTSAFDRATSHPKTARKRSRIKHDWLDRTHKVCFSTFFLLVFVIEAAKFVFWLCSN